MDATILVVLKPTGKKNQSKNKIKTFRTSEGFFISETQQKRDIIHILGNDINIKSSCD